MKKKTTLNHKSDYDRAAQANNSTNDIHTLLKILHHIHFTFDFNNFLTLSCECIFYLIFGVDLTMSCYYETKTADIIV